MTAPRRIRGAFGGGGGGGQAPAQHTPVEAPDSLRSRAVARVLDMVSEGEIEGLVDGYRSVYLDGTPLQNADGTLNFQNVSVAFTPGTQDQQYFAGFPESEAETQVEVEALAATPVVRTITNSEMNAVRVRVAVPLLYAVNTGNGDTNGNTVGLAIDVQSNGGGFVTKVAESISGKASSRYERDYRVTLTGAPPWDIRVRKTSGDATSQGDQRRLFFASYVAIIDAKLRHPNSAIVGVTLDSTQFSRVPQRSYRLRGLIVRVPSNYNAATREYTGVWDGSFTVAWTDNPAWCWYDLVTAERYGLGQYINPALIDKWALYVIGRYCDELVPDGFGGLEPRFRLNVYLQTLREAFDLLANLASVFRSMLYVAGGALTCVQDAPSDPVALFEPTNIIGGYPEYSGSSIDQRHTVAIVMWNDPDNHFRQTPEHVEDPEGIARYGVRVLRLTGIGITSRGQAHRFGRWALFTERMETDTASWSAGQDAAYVRPGQIVRLHDPRRAGKRLGGRLAGGSTTGVLQLDRAITLEAGKTYTATVVLPDLSTAEAQVTTPAGSVTALTLATALPAAPLTQAIWMLSMADLLPQLVRVLRVAEVDAAYQITGLIHQPAKFAAIESGLALQPRAVSSLSGKAVTPTGLALAETLYVAQGLVKVLLTATCQRVGGARYLWSWRRDEGNQSEVVETGSPELTLPDVLTGRYVVQVSSFSVLGTSTPAVATLDVKGRGATLAPVTGLTTVFQGGLAKLVWNGISDVRPFDYEVRLGASTGTAAVLGTSPTTEFPTRGNGTYWVAGRYLAPDGSAVYSSAWASVVVAGAQLVANVIATHDEAATGWTGTMGGGAFLDSPVITLTGAGDILAEADILAVANILFSNGIEPTGTYTVPVGHRIDGGREAYCGISMSYEVSGGSLDDDVIGVADVLATEDILGDRFGAYVRARPQLRVAPASGVYGDWTDYVPGQVYGQFFDARVVLESLGPQFFPRLSAFTFSVDVPDRFDRYTAEAIASGGTTLTFTPAFNGGPGGAAKPLIQGTILNATAGDDLKITADSVAGATFQVVNGGSGVARSVNITVEGY